MSRHARLISVLIPAALLLVITTLGAQRQDEPRPRAPEGQRQAEPRKPAPQRHAVPRPPAPKRPPVAVRGERIFVGGYFYDPFFGPYPWWTRPAYRHRYFPAYEYRAEVRVLATPKEAAVYIDGFYAGIVDDFDGVFQTLLVPPGSHSFVLYLMGYRTAEYNVYVTPGSTFKLHHTMERLPAGETSAPPSAASSVPPPPAGSARSPRTPPPTVPVTPPPVADALGVGTLEIRVQPAEADLRIDGHGWATSDPGHFVVQVADGRHRVEVSRDGYHRFSTDIDVREGKVTPMNVSLPPEEP